MADRREWKDTGLGANRGPAGNGYMTDEFYAIAEHGILADMA